MGPSVSARGTDGPSGWLHMKGRLVGARSRPTEQTQVLPPQSRSGSCQSPRSALRLAPHPSNQTDLIKIQLPSSSEPWELRQEEVTPTRLLPSSWGLGWEVLDA